MCFVLYNTVFWLEVLPIKTKNNFMESIISSTCPIHFNSKAAESIEAHLKYANYSNLYILVDENTREHCLPLFEKHIGSDYEYKIIEISSGEVNKNIDTCLKVWNILSDENCDRKSLLINLGGGVITDLGGFVASTYKRGINFINIPTTLLAMVDASVGGKTGVDLGMLKNQIGVINQPQMVLIFPEFLHTLENRQLNSGFAEMLKHGLITNQRYWSDIKNVSSLEAFESFIYESIVIKNEVVRQDPTEKSLRKILNFGHTLGHAIESYFLDNENKSTLLHGEAIAVGMIMEAFLSHKLIGLSIYQLEDIKSSVLQHFKPVSFESDDVLGIIDLLKYDKKNSHGNVNFVLLKRIGDALIDNKVSDQLINEAFAYYTE